MSFNNPDLLLQQETSGGAPEFFLHGGASKHWASHGKVCLENMGIEKKAIQQRDPVLWIGG